MFVYSPWASTKEQQEELKLIKKDRKSKTKMTKKQQIEIMIKQIVMVIVETKTKNRKQRDVNLFFNM